MKSQNCQVFSIKKYVDRWIKRINNGKTALGFQHAFMLESVNVQANQLLNSNFYTHTTAIQFRGTN